MMTSSVDSTRHLCLPVRRDVNRFVWDKSQPDGLEDLIDYSLLSDYFETHYESVESPVEWRGLTITTRVLVPRDVDDSAYAIVDESWFRSPHAELPTSRVELMQRLSEWLETHLAYGEPSPIGGATRIRTEFVEPRLELWDETAGPSGESLGWREILNHGRVVVLGDAGAGKTTLLRNIALREASRTKTTRWWRLPVYIPLREISPVRGLLSMARSQLASYTSMKADAEFDSALLSGRLLLLLDGLDEVADDVRSDLVKEIQSTSREWPAVGMYIGTRQWAYDWRFPGFLQAKLRPFAQDQIQEWLQRRLARTSESLTSALVAAFAVDSDLLQLASTPLMLWLLASVYERTGSLPRRKADLVARYLDTVLETWDASRGVRRSAHDFLKEEKTEALAVAALATWRDEQSSFTEEHFCSLQQSWSRLKSSDAGSRVLRDSGLLSLVRGHEHHWYFTHDVFQDYLCALYLVVRPDDMIDWLGDRIESQRSLRLWRYACGITTDATRLLSAVATSRMLPGYEKARWLSLALTDGVNASSEEIERTARQIVDERERGTSDVKVSTLEVGEQSWRMSLSGPEPEVDAIGDVVRVLVAGGWGGAGTWILQYLMEANSAVAKTISGLLAKRWIVKKVNDLTRRTVDLAGSTPYPARDVSEDAGIGVGPSL